jgi:hypothetical protein
MSDTTDEQLLWRQLELETADRVKAWRELQEDDYDFRSWAGVNDASKQLLQAGSIYEYARESRKLRCLLALMNPKRPRRDWEIMRPALIDGRRPEPGEIDTYPAEANWLPCWFEDLNEHNAERTLDGFLYCLSDLADYLSDNVSFGKLFCTKGEELEKAFGGLNELARVKREFRHFLPLSDAVEMATQSELHRATVEETVSDKEKRVIQGESCSEVIAIKIRWRFTDTEIAAGMKEFAHAHRHPACEPRKGKGRDREDSRLAALDNLSAMRLIRWRPIGEAVRLFEAVRLNARGGKPEQRKVRDQKTEAESDFLRDFPFGEAAANHGTFALL